jgi:hypothetical protein
MAVGNYQENAFGGRMFNQGLYEVSSTQNHRIGTIRALDDGRKFAYAQAGGVALSPGKLTQMPVPAANHNECVVADTAVGSKRIYITLGATAAAKDLYKDGYLHINKNTGIGHIYRIRGHAAIGSGGAGYIELYDAIRVATASSAEASLNLHPQAQVIVHPSPPTAALAGVPAVDVPISYYFWNQVKGPCCVLTEGTLVINRLCVPSLTVDGGVAPFALVEAAPPTGHDQQVCGTVIRVNITAEYSLINLRVPGY